MISACRAPVTSGGLPPVKSAVRGDPESMSQADPEPDPDLERTTGPQPGGGLRPGSAARRW
nr:MULTISPECIES: DUF6480 family protein [Streptomyces]